MRRSVELVFMLAALGLPIQGAAAQLEEKKVLTLGCRPRWLLPLRRKRNAIILRGSSPWRMTGAGRSCCGAVQEVQSSAGGCINHDRFAPVTARDFIETQVSIVVDG